MRRGEIWWIERPDHKRRHALVLTRDESIDNLYDILVVPLTTTVRHLPTDVPLGPDDGVPRESVANLQNVTTMPKANHPESSWPARSRPVARGVRRSSGGDRLLIGRCERFVSAQCSKRAPRAVRWLTVAGVDSQLGVQVVAPQSVLSDLEAVGGRRSAVGVSQR